jgi:Flp pilus assembly protein CpaB
MNIKRLRPLLIAYRRWIAASLVALAISILVTAGKSQANFQVVTAVRNIDAGSVVKASDFQLVPINFVWKHSLTEIDSLIGSRTTRSLEKNEPLSQSDIASKKIFDPSNPNAVAITLSKNVSASDLQTGDRVDVYAAAQNGSVKRVVTNALVLNQHTQKNLLDSSATVSLAVRAEQIAQIAAIDSTAQFTFVTLTSE